jgi:cell division protein FtsB
MAGRNRDKEYRRFKRPHIPGRLPARRLVVIGILSVLFYLLVLSNFGLLRQLKLSRESAGIESEIVQLENRKRELEGERGRLDDDVALEKIAREEYGMVKTGEHVYRIAGPDSSGNNDGT